MDAKIAAAVARRHGLGLSDAAALARMCDSEGEAEQIAAAFASPTTGNTSAAATAFSDYFTAALGTPSGAELRDAIANDQETSPDA